jgi:hypothetical protein
VNEILDQAKPLVANIRSGFRAQNEEVQKQLSEQLKQLEQYIHAAGELAHLGEQQARLGQDVRELLWDCERAKTVLNENLDDCNDRSRPGYETCWRKIDTIFESIAKEGDLIDAVQADGLRWFDDVDRVQVMQRVNDYTQAQSGAAEAVSMRAAMAAQQRIDSMCRHLDQVSAALSRTMYDKIFHSLQTLGH